MKHKLTQQDVDKMKAEIEHRKVEVRPELLEHVKEARAHGDLSENFEYHAAKKEKNRNESRIRYLERMIRTCEIVEDHSNADQVGLNKTVTLYFEEDDETDKFSFVTTVLVDTMQNRVSIESPLGKALLGHKKGERVYIPVNAQYGYYVEIKEIELEFSPRRFAHNQLWFILQPHNISVGSLIFLLRILSVNHIHRLFALSHRSVVNRSQCNLWHGR